MPISRRSFLKYGVGGLVLTGFGFDVTAAGPVRPLRVTRAQEAFGVCPLCAVGCGIVAHLLGGAARHGRPLITHIEGDSDHPISQGALCSKGASLKEFIHNPKRLVRPFYRARTNPQDGPGWRVVTWDFALDALAQRIKAARDAAFVERDENDRIVNRLETVAFVGGAAGTNESNYLAAKTMRSLGLVYVEQQGRFGQAASAEALSATFGLSGMMNPWVDLRNADTLLIMGSNPAETQPVGFQWVLEARRRRRATIICVDTRMTRTAALADMFVPIRAGADLALLGGLIHHTLSNDLYHADYVRLYTNAGFLVREGYDFQDGLFSGLDEGARRYDKTTWGYEVGGDSSPQVDTALEHPRGVFQLLKAHFSRYTPQVVSELTGISPEAFAALAEKVCSTGRPDRAGAILYAAGWAQHGVGAQTIRAAAILQLLLGNIGRSGGGLHALHGHGNTQGSSAHGLASHELPGRLPLPRAEHITLQQHLEASAPRTGVASGAGAHAKYLISLLRTWYGRSDATSSFGFHHLPKLEADVGFAQLYDAMLRGKIDGLIVCGANPLAGAPNTARMLRALSRLKWLAVIDAFETETAQFWHAPGVDAASVTTEVFLLPAALFSETAGSITNACRWTQWREALSDPLGEARSDLSTLAAVWSRVHNLYESEGGANPDPILQLSWPYADPRAPSPEEIAREINGVTLERGGSTVDSSDAVAGALLTSPRQLRADGSTACGNWLYCGSMTDAGNQMARRSPADPSGLGLFPEWAWAAPGDQRILFNRASTDRNGTPWDPSRVPLYWDGQAWAGDAADLDPPLPPEQSPNAFTTLPEGVARIFAPSMADGPFPEHYEPAESPVQNLLHPAVSGPPLRSAVRSELDKYGQVSEYPVVCTTFRLAEHFHWWTSHWPTSREWQPDFFVEMPEGLAQSLRVRSGDIVRVTSARGGLEGRALVTPRIRPLTVGGRTLWQIGLPIHWGPAGRLDGALVNNLTPANSDANSGVPEFKAFLVRVEKV